LIAVEMETASFGDDFELIRIPEHLYAVFETERCESPDDEWLPLMKRIIAQWLPSSGYVLSNHPQINKLYFDEDISRRYMELWLPVEKGVLQSDAVLD